MAGKKGRSGRRRIAATKKAAARRLEKQLDKGFETYGEIRAFILAVTRAIVRDELDHTKGRELKECAKEARNNLVKEKSEGRLPEFRRILAEAKANRKAGDAHAAMIRQHRDEGRSTH